MSFDKHLPLAQAEHCQMDTRSNDQFQSIIFCRALLAQPKNDGIKWQ